MLRATEIPAWTQLLDTRLLKGRAGEAFVENVFQQSGYRVSRVGRESHVQQLLKEGKAEFLPDFLVWKPVSRAEDPTLHRLFCVEVKYRADVEGFLRRVDGGPLASASEQWPDLKVVIVTDRPASGRSCFQLLDLARQAPDAPLHTVDLHAASELEISGAAVEEHEELVRGVFTLLAAKSLPARVGDSRKPPVKVASFLLALLASLLV